MGRLGFRVAVAKRGAGGHDTGSDYGEALSAGCGAVLLHLLGGNMMGTTTIIPFGNANRPIIYR
jgi:hypothetical protein